MRAKSYFLDFPLPLDSPFQSIKLMNFKVKKAKNMLCDIVSNFTTVFYDTAYVTVLQSLNKS